jgi:hypothetical protein
VVAGAAALVAWSLASCSGDPAGDGAPAGGPVALDVPPGKPPAACRELLARLPVALADQGRRDIAPSDAAGAAWGDPPITLVCGVGVPAGFDDVASCLTVSGVDWYIPTAQLEAQGDLTMTTVNREVSVEVHLPAAYFPPATALADLARPVKRSIPASGHCF